MAQSQGYGRFLTYLLVKKALELKVDQPSIIAEHLIVEFDDLTNQLVINLKRKKR